MVSAGQALSATAAFVGLFTEPSFLPRPPSPRSRGEGQVDPLATQLEGGQVTGSDESAAYSKNRNEIRVAHREHLTTLIALFSFGLQPTKSIGGFSPVT